MSDLPSVFDLPPLSEWWLYSVSSGKFEYVDNREYIDCGVGYSGKGRHINRSVDEWRRGLGPIPRGSWIIGDPVTHPRLGKLAFPLRPGTRETKEKLDRYGRAGFYIHGDNRLGNRSASSGCIILGPGVRAGIADALRRRSIRRLDVGE